MKRNHKLILIIVCLLVIVLGVYALIKPYGLVQYVSDNNFEYTETKDGITLTKYLGENKNIIIPSQIDGKDVTSLKGTFCGNNIIENVIVSDGIEVIDYMTFWHCINLVSVDIPKSVTTIGHASFNSCISLKEIKGNLNFTYIMPYAFENCSFIKKINLPKTLTFIGENAFLDCKRLESIVIPAATEIIGGTTDEKKTDINGSVIISDDQRGSTQKKVFDGCENLKITIEENNKYYYCENNIIKSKIK